jgi:hypothetical protein
MRPPGSETGGLFRAITHAATIARPGTEPRTKHMGPVQEPVTGRRLPGRRLFNMSAESVMYAFLG